MYTDSDSNSQPLKRKTLNVSIDNADLLQGKVPTDLYRDKDKGGAAPGIADRVPTERVERPVERTIHFRPTGDMKPKLPASKWLVGWLVAISGPMQGTSFPLTIGNNHVGRGKKNSIILAEDPTVSEESQIIVTYVKTRGEFYVLASMQGTQTTLLNDAPLLTPQPLTNRDVITLSDYTKLCFVPFCDREFQWETLENGANK